jgi:hypothetical protein
MLIFCARPERDACLIVARLAFEDAVAPVGDRGPLLRTLGRAGPAGGLPVRRSEYVSDRCALDLRVARARQKRLYP